MIDAPQIVQTEAKHTAVIRFTIPRSEIQTIMGQAIGEVIGAVRAQGIGPVGPVFSHHFKMQPDIFDFEVGVPVSEPVKHTGRVTASSLPATTVAQTTYHGPYEGLGEAWGDFCDWIESNGHTTGPGLWECYVAGPESGPDASQWRTELNKPLAS